MILGVAGDISDVIATLPASISQVTRPHGSTDTTMQSAAENGV